MVARLVALYGRARAFHYRYREIIMIFLGVFWTAAALFLIVISVIVFAQQSEREHDHRREARTVREACERAKVSGPPLIEHIERVEARLHTGALERDVEWPPGSRKFQGVLDFYRSTIPASCPK